MKVTTERPQDILPRMLADRWRVEAGERRLTEAIRSGAVTGPVGVALLDIDKSGVVRACGLEAKMSLVGQFGELISRHVPPEVTVVDSGSRDEVYLIAPDSDPARLSDLAERLRGLVKTARFDVAGIPEPLRLTVSVGVAVIPDPQEGGAVLHAARAALRAAKQQRDCVRFADPAPIRQVDAAVPERVLAILAEHEVPLDQALRTGLWILDEKHGPMRYWVAERGEADTGRLPVIPYQAPADIPADVVAFFDLLVRSVALESAMAARAAAGRRLRVRVRAERPDTGDLVVRYLPGEWLTVDHLGLGDDPAPADAFDLVSKARHGDLRRTVRLDTDGECQMVLATLHKATGREPGALATEALTLTTDRLRAGERARARPEPVR